MKKLLALDIGEVCIKLHPEVVAAKMAELGFTAPPEKLLYAVEALETGKMSEDDFFALIAKELEISPEDAVSWFNRIIGVEMPGMKGVIEMIAPEWEFVFLSDVSRPHLAICRQRIGFFDRARGGVFSFDAGVRKPGEAIYEDFERRYGVPDLYVDDRPQNIAGAEKRGWRSHRFTSVAELVKVLQMFDK